MEGFDFNMAVDPWVDLDPMQRFWVVVIRLRDGNAPIQLIKRNDGQEEAVKMALMQIPLIALANLKDVNVIPLEEMIRYERTEASALVQEIIGGTNEMP